MRVALALICYTACFVFLYAAYVTPEWEALSKGFPRTDREYMVALLVANAMGAKLLGHVFLLSLTKAR
jgi:hypothetical protein